MNRKSLTLLAALLITGCAQKSTENTIEPAHRNLSGNHTTFIYNAIPRDVGSLITTEYASAVNRFSLNLLSELYSESAYSGKNLILSPFSASRVLSVLAEGSTGLTRSEILSALGGETVLNDAKSALSAILYADSSVVFQCADAIWFDSSRFSLLESFKTAAASKYGTAVKSIDFGNPTASAAVVNQWISDNTAGKVKEFMTPDRFDDRLAMISSNAVWFEADWSSPFDISKTSSQMFHANSGDAAVPMMVSSGWHDTRETSSFVNARLYYGTSNRDFFYMDIYMPVSGTVETLLADLDVNSSYAAYQKRSIALPKFDFSSDLNLNDGLKKLGMNGMFNPQQNEMTKIVSNPDAQLWVKDVRQKAGIKTDEEGTKAYAVTVAEVDGVTSAGPDDPIVFDRPFVYFIRGGNGLILFAGVVNNPLQK